MADMEWTTYHTELRDQLSQLFLAKDTTQRIATEAGMKITYVNFDKNPANLWFEIIQQAEAQGVLIQLIERALLQIQNETLIEIHKKFQIYEKDKAARLTEQKAGGLVAKIDEKVRSTKDSEQRKLGEAVKRFVEELRNKAEKAKKPSKPYKGRNNYDLNDSSLFFGREAAIKEIMENYIYKDKLTILHSESGAGKTSLIKAGIRDELIRSDCVPVYIHIHPNEEPIRDRIKFGIFSEYASCPSLKNATLKGFLKQVTEFLDNNKLVLLIDQFEQALTAQGDNEIEDFARDLYDCITDELLEEVYWLIAVRGDRLSDIIRLFGSTITDHLRKEYALRLLTSEEARQAIIMPAKGFGVSFEEDVVQMILKDIGNPGVLPAKLQLVCSTLFDNLGERTTVTKDMYFEAEGANGIIRKHFHQTFNKNILEHRDCARNLLDLLITPDRKRTIKSKNELFQEAKSCKISVAEFDKLLQGLVTSNIVQNSIHISDEGSSFYAYELFHDSLIEEVEDNAYTKKDKIARQLFDIKASSYSTLNDPELLLGKEEYEFVNSVIHDDTLDPEHKKFLEDSKYHISETVRQERDRQIKTFIAGGVVIGALLLFLVRDYFNLLQALILSFFWILVIIFGVIGATRSWVKEVFVTFSFILSLFLLEVLGRYVAPVRDFITPPNGYPEFLVRAFFISIFFVLGYLTPTISRLRLAGNRRLASEILQDKLLGFFLGAVNGYLVLGSILYFLIDSGFPVLPQPGQPNFEAAQQLLSYLPPAWLSIPTIYIAVVLAFLFILVILV